MQCAPSDIQVHPGVTRGCAPRKGPSRQHWSRNSLHVGGAACPYSTRRPRGQRCEERPFEFQKERGTKPIRIACVLLAARSHRSHGTEILPQRYRFFAQLTSTLQSCSLLYALSDDLARCQASLLALHLLVRRRENAAHGFAHMDRILPRNRSRILYSALFFAAAKLNSSPGAASFLYSGTVTILKRDAFQAASAAVAATPLGG